MSISGSETPTIGLGEHLRYSRMIVPSHQRDYKWKTEYIDQFIDDIIEAHKTEEPEYFCGLMVFVKSPNDQYSILDGQQRLATTVILYSAIRNWLFEFSEYERFANQIETGFLGDEKLGDTKITPKLKLNATNDQIFKDMVINRRPLSEVHKRSKDIASGDRNRALLDAIKHINTRIKQIAEEHSDPEATKDYLITLANYLEYKVRVVLLTVKNEDSAYTIFETLNDRGMELAPLDLVKNHLFGLAARTKGGEDLSSMEDRWVEMMTILENSKPDSFLRAFWAARHGNPGTAKLFGPFKETYSEPDKAYQVSSDLRDVAKDYVALMEPENGIWSRYTEGCRRHIEALKTFGSTQFHPLLLSALNQRDIFDGKKMKQLLRLVEVLAVRFSLVGKGRPGRIESLAARVAQQIHSGKLTSIPEIRRQLSELYRDDETFRQSFMSFGGGSQKQMRLVLELLEEQAAVSKSDLHSLEKRAGEVNLEHILPKKPGADWLASVSENDDIEEDERARLTNLIGNLCLISTKVNNKIGNSSFEEKKKSYASSGFSLTKSVAEKERWGKSEIEERQSKLAKLAVERWRFEELSQKSDP